MNMKLLLSALLLGTIAVACSQGAGATDPAATSEPGSDQVDLSAGVRSIATSQPATVTRPVLSLPTVTSVIVATPAATRTSIRPVATSISRSPVPSPTIVRTPTVDRRPTATPFVPIRKVPNATATPLWTPVPPTIAAPTPAPTATATPLVQPTISAAPDDLFKPVLNYDYTLPAGWSESRTDSSIVLADPSDKITVTITEKPVERWRYQTVIALGEITFPDRPSGWSLWFSNSSGPIKTGTAYEFNNGGTKRGVAYLNFIHWYVWGDMHVQLSAEIPQFDWASSVSIRSKLQSVLDTFTPHDETHLLTSDDVLAVMFERLDDRPSGIYARNDALRFRYELTCRDIYTDLMTEPEYLGTGLWQLTAQTIEGTETWWVFEPTGSIMTLNSNRNRC